jgi:predicted phage terminase large subunit-like protein
LSLLALEALPREDATQALRYRRLVRSRLGAWAHHCGFEPAFHHALIIRELEALERGEFDRLAIAAPPGSAKTTYASVLFPAWYLSRHPDRLVLSGSHTQEFARRKIGRKVRNVVDRNQTILDIEIARDSTAAEDWALVAKPGRQPGGYRAVGVGVAVAGERADLAIVEDPFARWTDAQSATVQDEVWDWYRGDFSARLKPNGKRVIIATRFNELDLTGRVIERDTALGLPWRYIRLPMLAEAGDALGRAVGERLWPEWFTDQMVIEARADAPKWNALYQQNPAPESGDYFKAEWLRPCFELPDRTTLAVYGASDYAVTSGGGDFTCHLVVGVDPEGRMYLLDLWRAQASSDVWIEKFCDLVAKWRPLGWAEERGQIISGVGPFLTERMRQRNAYTVREQFTSTADKSIRAQSIRGRMALNGLNVQTTAAWYPELRAELLTFPLGKHDDQVDALGLVGQLLDKMIHGSKSKLKSPAVETDSGYKIRDEDHYGGNRDSFLTL